MAKLAKLNDMYPLVMRTQSGVNIKTIKARSRYTPIGVNINGVKSQCLLVVMEKMNLGDVKVHIERFDLL